MLVIAENPAWQTYVLPNIARTFLQSFESSGKSLTFISHPKNMLEWIQQSHCACCAEQSCAADWVSPVVAHHRHQPVCAFWKLTKNGHWIGPHCLKFLWALAGHTECLHGPHAARGPQVGQHWSSANSCAQYIVRAFVFHEEPLRPPCDLIRDRTSTLMLIIYLSLRENHCFQCIIFVGWPSKMAAGLRLFGLGKNAMRYKRCSCYAIRFSKIPQGFVNTQPIVIKLHIYNCDRITHHLPSRIFKLIPN